MPSPPQPVLPPNTRSKRPDLATEPIDDVVPEVSALRISTRARNLCPGVDETSLDFTANVSASWFADVRPGMPGSFRDIRAGFEGTSGYVTLELLRAGIELRGSLLLLAPGASWFSVSSGSTTPEVNKPGHIGVSQAKLEFRPPTNAMRIPLSFTYSNRTELINETDVRGQIGISFNLEAVSWQEVREASDERRRSTTENGAETSVDARRADTLRLLGRRPKAGVGVDGGTGIAKHPPKDLGSCDSGPSHQSHRASRGPSMLYLLPVVPKPRATTRARNAAGQPPCAFRSLVTPR